jgi:hypothetical protein
VASYTRDVPLRLFEDRIIRHADWPPLSEATIWIREGLYRKQSAYVARLRRPTISGTPHIAAALLYRVGRQDWAKCDRLHCGKAASFSAVGKLACIAVGSIPLGEICLSNGTRYWSSLFGAVWLTAGNNFRYRPRRVTRHGFGVAPDRETIERRREVRIVDRGQQRGEESMIAVG